MAFRIPYDAIANQNEYGNREVGITHPDLPGFIKLCDNGDIEIIAGEGLSIVLSPKSNSITFVADSIKFLTRSDAGLRWNDMTFNPKATGFNQPTLITIDEKDSAGMYRGVEYFTSED